MIDSSYKYKAPDVAANPEAKFCACNRFVADVRKFPTLQWIVIFGDAGWQAINLLNVGSQTVCECLGALNIEVLNFPHFAQNFQQRAIFKLRPEQEESYFQEHPKHRVYAPAARKMRSALFSALRRKFPSENIAVVSERG